MKKSMIGMSGLLLVLGSAGYAPASPRTKRASQSERGRGAREVGPKARRKLSLRKRAGRDGRSWTYRAGSRKAEVRYEAMPRKGIHMFDLKVDGYRPKTLIVDTRTDKVHPKESRWRGNGLYEAGIYYDLHNAIKSPMQGFSTAKLLKEVDVSSDSLKWPRPKPSARAKKLADQIANDALTDVAERDGF